MLMFTNEPIQDKPALGTNAARTGSHYRAAEVRQIHPYLPGQIYLAKYMGLPVIVTILARTDTTVTWFARTESINRFNAHLICYLGYRASLLGMWWLPWAHINPTLVVSDMPVSVSNDPEFWKVTEAQMLQADECSTGV
jgi:hypothetical protein